MMRIFIIASLLGATAAVSPVQKVIELLGECKAKVEKDLAAEAAVMEEYTTFCDDELKEKGYAIETAGREIGDLMATIEDSKATIIAKTDEMAELGTLIAAKQKEHAEASAVRTGKNEEFMAAEKELVTSVDECSRAVVALEKGMALMQGGRKREAKQQLKAVKMAMTSVLAGIAIDTESTRKLKSFIQSSTADTENDDLTLKQPQAKQVAYESKSGGIIQTVKDMQSKAEGELSDLRKKEMADAHEFKMLDQSLSGEISHGNEKLSSATKAKAGAEETLSTAEGDKVATEKSKAADEEYSTNLKTECETAAKEWAARQESAKAEMAAIDKASEILASGVTALVQVKTNKRSFDDDSEDDAQSEMRQQLVRHIHGLGKKFHSFGLMQLASVASSDPFVKIRGLIEDMIAKLLKEAQEEATQKAFCDKEMGASKASQAKKTATIDKLQARIDGNSATIAELEEAVKSLEAEVAEIDKAQAEATAIRNTEKTDNLAAIKDFRDSADAVVAAMGVLKSFYEGGAFIQTRSQKAARPEFGGAKTDAGSGIISVLEVAESDFTRLLAETETEEDAAADAYAKSTEENKISKTTKEADSKAKQSEIKSLTVELGHAKEDHASVSTELDAVNAYVDKLRPQCEEKAMSYEEKKAAREAEIAGLKEALEILSGTGLLQSHSRFLGFNKHY
jgi:hypothetical protein